MVGPLEMEHGLHRGRACREERRREAPEAETPEFAPPPFRSCFLQVINKPHKPVESLENDGSNSVVVFFLLSNFQRAEASAWYNNVFDLKSLRIHPRVENSVCIDVMGENWYGGAAGYVLGFTPA
ncbi:hypothetical protein NL676_019531 [Syzygium grande]|nr:hypothetical protein NL676_019531 [Syzygium grande]